jgi:peroxiredoxin
MRSAAVVTAVATAIAAISFSPYARAEDCARKVGERLPQIKGTDQNDKATSVQAGPGWVFVTVGASWCDPCAKELPAWDKLAPDFPKITWVAVDISEKTADGKAFHSKLGIKNMSRVYTREANIGNLGSVMPSSYVVDPKGVIRYERCGFEKEGVDDEVKTMRAQLTKLVP